MCKYEQNHLHEIKPSIESLGDCNHMNVSWSDQQNCCPDHQPRKFEKNNIKTLDFGCISYTETITKVIQYNFPFPWNIRFPEKWEYFFFCKEPTVLNLLFTQVQYTVSMSVKCQYGKYFCCHKQSEHWWTQKIKCCINAKWILFTCEFWCHLFWMQKKVL